MAKYEQNEELKPIVMTDNDTGFSYTLEFNRESIRFAEQRGFDSDDVAKYPMTKIPELFFYAFRMHHKNISREKTDKILFEELGGMPKGMLERLMLLYQKPYEVLNENEDTKEAKNSKLTIVF